MFELKLLAACALWFAGNLVIVQHGATSWFWLDASAVSSAPWRLWSGHLVHQDMYHAALDIGFFAAEALLARRAFIVPVIVVAPIVSLIVMALRPELGYYVGASALGYFAASYSAIVLGGWRGLACFAPCLRPIYHLLTAAPVAAAPWTGGLVPVMEAHVAGIGLGVTFALVAVTTRTRRAGQAGLLSPGHHRAGTRIHCDAPVRAARFPHRSAASCGCAKELRKFADSQAARGYGVVHDAIVCDCASGRPASQKLHRPQTAGR